MLDRVKHLLIGNPLPTYQLAEIRLNKIRALAAFSPDGISSIAYANQEIYLGLVVAGSSGLIMAWPIGLAIAVLLGIVAISYYQTIHAYPSGGGSYVVARENLGMLAGLVTGSALLIGYLLTAAVSLTAAVEAIASAFPELWQYRTPLALILLTLISLANLRGLRETGTLLAFPVYLFLFLYLLMLLYGFLRLVADGTGELATAAPMAVQPLTMILILHAFSTGCTALTGIEAISNGVPVFNPPEAKNAGRTLIVMAFLMGILFVGSVGLTRFLAVTAREQETILSALARTLLNHNPGYYLIQFATLMVLAVAANTSFAGFPRLSAILAQDGFLPRQLTSLGERLVFSNGIIVLAVSTGVLIVIFGGESHALIPLFAVGVFMAFTLSQAGMVNHWRKSRSKGWEYKLVLNGLGAITTGITVLVVGYSNFTNGAWITIFLIPLLVIVFYQIKKHYQAVGKQLSLRGLPPSLKPTPIVRIVIPVSGVHRGIVDAIDYARAMSNDITGVYIELEPGSSKRIQELWQRWFPDVPLVVVQSPYRSIIGPLLDYLDETDRQHNDGQLAALVLPEFIPARWWQNMLHNQTSRAIKNALLYRRRNLGFQRVIIDIPYHLKH